MPVRQLGRVADTLRRYGGQPTGEQGTICGWGKLNPEAQFRKQSEPERVVRIDCEHARDAQNTSRGVFHGQGRVVEQPTVFPVINIGSFFSFLRAAVGEPVATIARKMPLAMRETGFRKKAVVAAIAAAKAAAAHLEAAYAFSRYGRPMLLLGRSRFKGRQGSAVRPHKPGRHRTVYMMPQGTLHGAEQGIIEERSALHHHMLSQFVHIFYAQDFVQSITHHGIAQARGNIGGLHALFLRLSDLGIHEHRAARSQISRMFGIKGGPHKCVHVHAEADGKAFKKSSAAGGTGFVEAHTGNDAVFCLEALHVLPADVNDIADFRNNAVSGLEVRQSFNGHAVELQGRFGKLGAIACGCSTRKPCLRRNLLKHVCQGRQKNLQGVTAIGDIA